MPEVTLPRHEEIWLAVHVTGRPRHEVVAGVDLSPAEAGELAELRHRRLAGEPLQYLIGHVAFGPLELRVDPRVLIPRPETEQLWERVLQALPTGPCTVVDLGTGSGCIALAVKHARPDARVTATDVSTGALEVARSNASRLGLDVTFEHGDLFAAVSEQLRGAVDVVVSNPPYVSSDEWESLPVEVRDHEPREALIADDDGLGVIARIAAEAGPWLAVDGRLLIEIGETQGRSARALLERHGWAAIVRRDLADRDRFVEAWRDT